MRSVNLVVSVTLLSLNVRHILLVSDREISCLHAVQADGWAGQRGDGGGEVSLTASGLAHLVLAELLVLVEIEIIIMLPEAVSAGFVCSSEIL